MTYSTTYYWKIVAKDSHGATTEGPVWSFTTTGHLKGDLNGDGNVTDAKIVLQVLAGQQPTTLKLAADVNGNGKIGMAEVIYILRKVAEM